MLTAEKRNDIDFFSLSQIENTMKDQFNPHMQTVSYDEVCKCSVCM